LFMLHWIYTLHCGFYIHQQQSGTSECGNFGACASVSSWLGCNASNPKIPFLSHITIERILVMLLCVQHVCNKPTIF
jgi:hypothetical protein